MTEQSQAIGILTQLGIDVSDLGRAEAFYSALLGVKRFAAHDNYLNFEPLPGGLTVYLQKVPEEKTSKTRVHLDVTVKDMEASLAAGGGAGRKEAGVIPGRRGRLDGRGGPGRERTLLITRLGSVFPEDGVDYVQGVVNVLGAEAIVGDESPVLVSGATFNS